MRPNTGAGVTTPPAGTPAGPDASTDTSVVRALRRLRVPQTQRNRELFLLVFALVITTGAIALVQLGAIGSIDGSFLVYSGVPAVLAVALHVVLRLRARAADPFVLPIAVVLTGLGIAMIYRIDIARQVAGWDAASTRQLVWATIAVALAVVVALFAVFLAE